jgi:protein-S-isoprenylcysteine O-methyltransferase Ste14
VTPAALAVIVAGGYASLVFELTVLHVPSAASARNLWLGQPSIAAGFSPARRAIFGFAPLKKVTLLLLPVLVIWGVYAYPPIALLTGGDPLGDQLFTPSAATRMVAALLIVGGRAITLGSVLTLRRAGRRAIEGGLAVDGLFRYSRNPGLVGMYTFVLGLWLATPSLAMLCGILVYVVHMDFKVRLEEDFLANTVGEGYRLYERRTRRYLP